MTETRMEKAQRPVDEMTKRIGYLGRCGTPYCGGIYGYFCVKCRHYVTDCDCGYYTGGCTCRGEDYGKWWASTSERRMLERKLAVKEVTNEED